MNKPIALVISCEHAVNAVPEAYQPLFQPFQHRLDTHEGIDFGALDIAKYINTLIPCDFFQAWATRLLVDCNRSLTHSQCFSDITKNLPAQTKQAIIEEYYKPYRTQLTESIENHLAKGEQVWHLSIHSFTPVLNGNKRNADIGLLYDPSRFHEKTIAKRLQLELQQQHYKVRMNYPYLGISDGFTTALRKKYSAKDYVGIEIESNQALTRQEQSLATLKNILTLSLLKIMC